MVLHEIGRAIRHDCCRHAKLLLMEGRIHRERRQRRCSCCCCCGHCRHHVMVIFVAGRGGGPEARILLDLMNFHWRWLINMRPAVVGWSGRIQQQRCGRTHRHWPNTVDASSTQRLLLFLILLLFSLFQLSLFVLAPFVLEPNADNARIQAGSLHELILRDCVRSLVVTVRLA